MKEPQIKPPTNPLHCLECGGDTTALETRGNRRRRKCLVCGARYTTYEIRAEEWQNLKTLRIYIRSVLNMLNAAFKANAPPGEEEIVPDALPTEEEAIPPGGAEEEGNHESQE